MRKLLSLFLSVSILSSSLPAGTVHASVPAGEGTAVLQPSVDSLVPAGAGRITGLHYFGGSRLVINVQDLHCHPEVQKNIARVLAGLDKRYGLANVYVEGAYGEVDTSWLSGIGDPALRKEIAGNLLEQGRLTGTEYYSVLSGKPRLLKGIEDKELHQANIVRLGKILERKERFEKKLKELDRDLAYMKACHLSRRNESFDRLVERHRSGELSTETFYRLLGKYVEKINEEPGRYHAITHLSMQDYPAVSAYVELMQRTKELRYRQVSGELQACVRRLKERLPYREYKDLIARTNNFAEPDELYVFLTQAVRRDPGLVAGLPQLQRFLAYTELSGRLNPVELLDEERRLVEAVRVGLSNDLGELEVSFLSDFYAYFRDYLLNRLSAGDYAYFNQRFGKFKTIWSAYAFKDRIADLAGDFALLDEFYAVNDRRNDRFLRNIPSLRDIPAAPVTDPAETALTAPLAEIAGKTELTVVVTGGFHTEGLAALLRQHGISCLTITPQVTQDTVFSSGVYDKLARAQASILSNALALGLASQLSAPALFELAVRAAGRELQGQNFSRETLEKLVANLRTATGMEANLSVDEARGRARVTLANGAVIDLTRGENGAAAIEKAAPRTVFPAAAAARLSVDEVVAATAGTARAAADGIGILGIIPDTAVVLKQLFAFAAANGLLLGDGLLYELERSGAATFDGVEAELVARFPEFAQRIVAERERRHTALDTAARRSTWLRTLLAVDLLGDWIEVFAGTPAPARRQGPSAQTPQQKERGRRPSPALRLDRAQATALLGEIKDELVALAGTGAFEKIYNGYSPAERHVDEIPAAKGIREWLRNRRNNNIRVVMGGRPNEFFIAYREMPLVQVQLEDRSAREEGLAELNLLWVLPELRQDRLGTRLTLKLFEYLQARGFRNIDIVPAAGAVDYWKRFGIAAQPGQTGIVKDLQEAIDGIRSYLAAAAPRSAGEKEMAAGAGETGTSTGYLAAAGEAEAKAYNAQLDKNMESKNAAAEALLQGPDEAVLGVIENNKKKMVQPDEGYFVAVPLEHSSTARQFASAVEEALHDIIGDRALPLNAEGFNGKVQYMPVGQIHTTHMGAVPAATLSGEKKEKVLRFFEGIDPAAVGPLEYELVGVRMMQNFTVVLQLRSRGGAVREIRESARRANDGSFYVIDINHVSLAYIADATPEQLKALQARFAALNRQLQSLPPGQRTIEARQLALFHNRNKIMLPADSRFINLPSSQRRETKGSFLGISRETLAELVLAAARQAPGFDGTPAAAAAIAERMLQALSASSGLVQPAERVLSAGEIAAQDAVAGKLAEYGKVQRVVVQEFSVPVIATEHGLGLSDLTVKDGEPGTLVLRVAAGLDPFEALRHELGERFALQLPGSPQYQALDWYFGNHGLQRGTISQTELFEHWHRCVREIARDPAGYPMTAAGPDSLIGDAAADARTIDRMHGALGGIVAGLLSSFLPGAEFGAAAAEKALRELASLPQAQRSRSIAETLLQLEARQDLPVSAYALAAEALIDSGLHRTVGETVPAPLSFPKDSTRWNRSTALDELAAQVQAKMQEKRDVPGYRLSAARVLVRLRDLQGKISKTELAPLLDRQADDQVQLGALQALLESDPLKMTDREGIISLLQVLAEEGNLDVVQAATENLLRIKAAQGTITKQDVETLLERMRPSAAWTVYRALGKIDPFSLDEGALALVEEGCDSYDGSIAQASAGSFVRIKALQGKLRDAERLFSVDADGNVLLGANEALRSLEPAVLAADDRLPALLQTLLDNDEFRYSMEAYEACASAFVSAGIAGGTLRREKWASLLQRRATSSVAVRALVQADSAKVSDGLMVELEAALRGAANTDDFMQEAAEAFVKVQAARGKLRKQDIESLMAPDMDWPVRLGALKGLAGTDPALLRNAGEFLPVVELLLSDNVNMICEAAAAAVVRLRTARGRLGREDVEALIAKTAQAPVRAGAVRALGETDPALIDRAGILPLLIAALGDYEVLEVNQGAHAALGRVFWGLLTSGALRDEEQAKCEQWRRDRLLFNEQVVRELLASDEPAAFMASLQNRMRAAVQKGFDPANADDLWYAYNGLRLQGVALSYREFTERLDELLKYDGKHPGSFRALFTKADGLRHLEVSASESRVLDISDVNGKVLDDNIALLESRKARIDGLEWLAELGENKAFNLRNLYFQFKRAQAVAAGIVREDERFTTDLSLGEQAMKKELLRDRKEFYRLVFRLAKDRQSDPRIGKQCLRLMHDLIVSDVLLDTALAAELRSGSSEKRIQAFKTFYEDYKNHLPQSVGIETGRIKGLRELFDQTSKEVYGEIAKARVVKKAGSDAYRLVPVGFAGVFRGRAGMIDCSFDVDRGKGMPFTRAMHEDTEYYFVYKGGELKGYVGLMLAKAADGQKVLSIDTFNAPSLDGPELLTNLLAGLATFAREQGCAAIALPEDIEPSFNFDNKNTVKGLDAYKNGAKVSLVPLHEETWQRFTEEYGKDKFNSIDHSPLFRLIDTGDAPAVPDGGKGNASSERPAGPAALAAQGTLLKDLAEKAFPWVNELLRWAKDRFSENRQEGSPSVHHIVSSQEAAGALAAARSGGVFSHVWYAALPGTGIDGLSPVGFKVSVPGVVGHIDTWAGFRNGSLVFYLDLDKAGVPAAEQEQVLGLATTQIISRVWGTDATEGDRRAAERLGELAAAAGIDETARPGRPALFVAAAGREEGLKTLLSEAGINRAPVVSPVLLQAGTADRTDAQIRKLLLKRDATAVTMGENKILKMDVTDLDGFVKALELFNAVGNGQMLVDGAIFEKALADGRITSGRINELLALARRRGVSILCEYAVTAENAGAVEKKFAALGFAGVIAADKMKEVRLDELRTLSAAPGEILDIRIPARMTGEQLRAAFARLPLAATMVFHSSDAAGLIGATRDIVDRRAFSSLLSMLLSFGRAEITTAEKARRLGYNWDASDLPQLQPDEAGSRQVQALLSGDAAAAGLAADAALREQAELLATPELKSAFLTAIAERMLIVDAITVKDRTLGGKYRDGAFRFASAGSEELLGAMLLRQRRMTAQQRREDGVAAAAVTVGDGETLEAFLVRQTNDLRAGQTGPGAVTAVIDILLMELLSEYNMRNAAGEKAGTLDVRKVNSILGAA